MTVCILYSRYIASTEPTYGANGLCAVRYTLCPGLISINEPELPNEAKCFLNTMSVRPLITRVAPSVLVPSMTALTRKIETVKGRWRTLVKCTLCECLFPRRKLYQPWVEICQHAYGLYYGVVQFVWTIAQLAPRSHKSCMICSIPTSNFEIPRH